MTLLVVALAAGGCSAGFDRLGLAPMNYNGGPTSTGTAPPIPREPLRQSVAPLPPQGDYRSDYRPDDRQDYRPAYRPEHRSDGNGSFARDGDRSALPQSGDTSVRIAGLPEPYDRAQPYDRAPLQRTTPAPYDAGRAPSSPIPPAPPSHESYDPPGQAAQPVGNMVEVRPGDTLYGLSKTHRVPISELMRINNLTGPQLRVGQQLILPAGRRRVASLPTARAPVYEPPSAPEAAYEPPAAYVPPPAYVPPTPVRSAAPTRLPEPVLPHHRDAGPIVPPLVETPPQPAAPATREDTSGWTGTYTVARGDSLYAIARKHRINFQELARINEIADPRKVMPGTVLKVPKPGDAPRAVRDTPTPAPVAKSVPPIPPRSVATRDPMASSGAPPVAPPVQPTIINAREPAPAVEPKRVASLGQGMTDASPPGAPEPAARATDTPPREAALLTPKAPAPPGKFRWPARGKIIAGFGKQPGGGPSDGINISVPRGTDVHAAENGVVTYAGDEVQGYGNLVIIRHPEGWITAYAHNDSLTVKSGENVRRGQIIAKAGNTGSVTQPQLHFQIRQGATATPVDPTQHLER